MARDDVGGPESRLLTLATWVPVLFTVAFTIVLSARLGNVVDRVNWDADVASQMVIAATFDPASDAQVVFGHFGSYTILGWELLSRGLPCHRQLWEATSPAFALSSAALLGWASWRLAGRWAAAATVALCVCTSSWTTYNLFALGLHALTWFSVNVLAAYLVVLETTSIRERRAALSVSLLVGVVTGANAASDPMLVYFGLIPFALTGLGLLLLERRQGLPLTRLVGVVLGSAVVVAVAVGELAARLGMRVVEQPAQLASASDLWPNARRFARQILQSTNADFWDRGTSFTALTAVLCAAFVAGAAALALAGLPRRIRAGVRTPALRARTAPSYLLFWGIVIVLVPASYVVSTVGTRPGWYFVVLVYALAALTPILVGTGTAGRLAATAAVSIFCLASIVAVGRMAYPLDDVGVPAVAAHVPQLERIARQNRVAVAYTGFWSAAPLTWATDLRLRAYPVEECGQTLCPVALSVVSSWYEPRPGVRSMLVVVPGEPSLHDPPDAALGRPSHEIALGDLEVYVYGHDLASRFAPRRW